MSGLRASTCKRYFNLQRFGIDFNAKLVSERFRLYRISPRGLCVSNFASVFYDEFDLMTPVFSGSFYEDVCRMGRNTTNILHLGVRLRGKPTFVNLIKKPLGLINTDW